MNKEALTTGEAARACGVSVTLVVNWCNKGMLPHFKVPESRARRIRVRDLQQFMQAHKIPVIVDWDTFRGKRLAKRRTEGV